MTLTADGCTVTYPAPAEHVLHARELRPGVDPVDIFGRILGEIVADMPTPPDDLGIEISGGADSANVALNMAEVHGAKVRSFGLAMPGTIGAEQQQRRKTMVSTFGFDDTEIPAADHPPFALTGERARGVLHDPASSYYLEAFDALATAAAAAGVKVICTGLAGDEISGLHPYERQRHLVPDDDPPTWLGPIARDALTEVDTNIAPAPVLPVTALMAFALHNPGYLRAGIWPVAPLAHPLLVRFFEQLPRQWRQGKMLLRTRLRRTGFADEVAEPARPEEFTGVMEIGLRRHGLQLLRGMLRESLLIDVGYLDGDALATALVQAERTERVPSELCDAVGLEVGLRSITGQRATTQ